MKYKFLVSVIIPCFNVEDYIDDLLNSIYIEQDSRFEFLLVDDGSTDSTSKKIKEFVHVKRINNLIIINDFNQGLSAARNRGLSEASGEYIWFLDGDDAICSGSVKDLLGLLEKFNKPDVIVFQGYDFKDSNLSKNIELFNAKSKIFNLGYDRNVIEPRFENSLDYIQKTVINDTYLSNACYYITKKSIFELHQLQFVPGLIYEDVLFTVQLFLIKLNILIVPNKIILHRIRKCSITNSPINKKKLSSLIWLSVEFKKMYMKNKKPIFLWKLMVSNMFLALRNSRVNKVFIWQLLLRNIYTLVYLLLHSMIVRKEFVKYCRDFVSSLKNQVVKI